MNISANTKDIIDKINDSSDRFIKNNYEISILIEISFFSDKLSNFRDLIFTSKYINGLKKVLSSSEISGKDFIDKTYNDFNINLQKVYDILKQILENEESNSVSFFENKYFKMDQESIKNMIELIEDLSICKEFMNRTPGVF
ncbi:MAG: hypothetical protein WAT71_15425 [Ignavibacteria bacterium]